MKVLIDIADFVYDSVVFGETDYKEHICNAIRNGITIPDNATNVQIIKMLFPKDYTKIYDRSVSSWWNALYKGVSR